MGRVWALAGALALSGFVVFLFNGFLGGGGVIKATALASTVGLTVAYLPTASFLSRAFYAFGGVLLGALGFLIGSLFYPDNEVGLWLGGLVPALIGGLIAMWSKSQYVYLVVMLSSAAMGGAYVELFDGDPQAINYQLPISIGWVIVPLSLGYLFGVLVQMWVDTDQKVAAADAGADSETEEVNA